MIERKLFEVRKGRIRLVLRIINLLLNNSFLEIVKKYCREGLEPAPKLTLYIAACLFLADCLKNSSYTLIINLFFTPSFSVETRVIHPI